MLELRQRGIFAGESWIPEGRRDAEAMDVGLGTGVTASADGVGEAGPGRLRCWASGGREVELFGHGYVTDIPTRLLLKVANQLNG